MYMHVHVHVYVQHPKLVNYMYCTKLGLVAIFIPQIFLHFPTQQSPLVGRTDPCRPSFIPHVSSSPMIISEDSLNSTATTCCSAVDSDPAQRTVDAQVSNI